MTKRYEGAFSGAELTDHFPLGAEPASAAHVLFSIGGLLQGVNCYKVEGRMLIFSEPIQKDRCTYRILAPDALAPLSAEVAP